jgi:hypothetical protein
MAFFYFVFMMNYAEVMVINSFVNYFVKPIWLVRKATGAPLVASMVESTRGGTCPEAGIGS